MKFDFWSSTEYTGFLAGLIRELEARGNEARQRYHISEASYRAAKTPGARLFLRLRQYLVYPVHLVVKLLSGRIQNTKAVAVVSTNPFYAPLLATFFHRRVVHLVYDLYPEALIHSGKWREGTFKVKLVRWITKKTLRRAQLNVFLGQRLKGYVETLHGNCEPSIVIPVGADQRLFRTSPKNRNQGSGFRGQGAGVRGQGTGGGGPSTDSVPVILYCGNFGHLHDHETLFGFWEMVTNGAPTPLWKFHCSGPKRRALEKVVSELPKNVQDSIHLGGGLSQSEWIAALESADVALVTMVPGAEAVVMPSKTYSAMMAGQAVLAIAPEASDLVDTLKAANCGWWVEPGDVQKLEKVIGEIQKDPEGLLEKRERAYHHAHQHFGQDTLAKQWIEALNKIQ